MPVVSVIVPVYNVEKYIHRCVDSILAQTFTDFELLLVDDGSPDNCGMVCDEYSAKDGRVKVIHKQNGGVSSARNAGLDAAVGEYITFCDSDDYWDDDFLYTLVQPMRNSDADVVTANCRVVDENGVVQTQVDHSTGMLKIGTADDRFRYLVTEILGGKVGWEIWTRMFRREIIEKNHIRFCVTCSNFAEDLGFVLEYCLYAENCCSIEYRGYNYYLREDSMMRTSVGTVKLNSLNEVSYSFASAFRKALPEYEKYYPVIHFLFMRTEYLKLVGTANYARLKDEVDKITNKQYYIYQTKHIRSCYRMIVSLYGKKIARQILLISHYCVHGNWYRFSIESAIAYRFFIK